MKAVIFDVGGVLLRTHDWQGRHKWDVKLGVSIGTVEHTVFNSELGTAAQLGRVSTENHWSNIGSHFDLSNDDLQELRQDFWAGDRLDTSMVDMIRQLKKKYRTAIISNAFDDLRQVLTEELEIADLFDVITVSAEEGVMKPAAQIYQMTLDRLGCQPADAVFIDDNSGNIDGAQQIGLPAILFKMPLNLPHALSQYNVDI